MIWEGRRERVFISFVSSGFYKDRFFLGIEGWFVGGR